MDPRFAELLAEMGDAAMLEQCYMFVAFSTHRPTEEEREFLEAKFAQDRRYEEMRRPIAPPVECVTPTYGSYFGLEGVVLPTTVPRRVSFKLPAAPVEPLIDVPKEAERFWSAKRAKNFVTYLDRYNDATWGRVNHARALDLLARCAGITTKELFRTDPITYGLRMLPHRVGEEGLKQLLGRAYPL
jgi:hypothetical protein